MKDALINKLDALQEATDGLPDSLSLHRISLTDSSLLSYGSADMQYLPKNTVRNDRLSVRVVETEVNYKDLSLENKASNQIKDTPSSEQNDNSALIFNPEQNDESKVVFNHPLMQHFLSDKENEFSYLLEVAKDGVGSYRHTSESLVVEKGKLRRSVTQMRYQSKIDQHSINEMTSLFRRQMAGDRDLSEKVIDELDRRMINQYPLIGSTQPIKKLDQHGSQSFSDLILSRIYSSSDKIEPLMENAIKTYAQLSSYTRDVIKAIGLGISRGDAYPCVNAESHQSIDEVLYFVKRCEPMKIVHCRDQKELQENLPVTLDSEITGGYYSPDYNTITFKDSLEEGAELSSGFIHEACHAMMNHIFENLSMPFAKENAIQERKYKNAELAVFKKLCAKLGMPNDKICILDNTQDIIAALKKETIIDLIQYQVAAERLDLFELKEKYFSNDNIDFNVLHSKLADKLKQEINRLKLKPEDLHILTEFSYLLYEYNENMLTTELIVRIPQLLVEGVSELTLQHYFKPLMKYWDQTVTPAVHKMEISHRQNCAELSLDNSVRPTYCNLTIAPEAKSRSALMHTHANFNYQAPTTGYFNTVRDLIIGSVSLIPALTSPLLPLITAQNEASECVNEDNTVEMLIGAGLGALTLAAGFYLYKRRQRAELPLQSDPAPESGNNPKVR